jgi:hypothetical protein
MSTVPRILKWSAPRPGRSTPRISARIHREGCRVDPISGFDTAELKNIYPHRGPSHTLDSTSTAVSTAKQNLKQTDNRILKVHV